MIQKSFWNGKTVLITGHTGFKGSWLSIWLDSMGANVVGYALNPNTEKDNYVLCKELNNIVDLRGDIRDIDSLRKVFDKYNPEIILHLAAQPLVRLSYEYPKDTYETNVMGTLNILECIRNCNSTKVAIMVTTDKCYENKEQIWGYKEDDPMGGYDPYSSSKACAEILISSYRNSFFNPNNYMKHRKSIASVRAGNVIGGGDWANDRIIPDCIRAIESNQSIKIRNPKAVRPWQHVLEPLSGYILLAQRMYEDPIKYSQSWNFGPNLDSIIPVWNVAEKLVECIGEGKLEDCSDPLAVHEATLLSLDISKARFLLNWKPKMSIDETIKMTADWYKTYLKGNIYALCLHQISKYLNYK